MKCAMCKKVGGVDYVGGDEINCLFKLSWVGVLDVLLLVDIDYKLLGSIPVHRR